MTTHGRDGRLRDGEFWVFGYGSLMWRTGFDYVERRTARLDGYRRAFHLESVRYRGTEENPGLVVGLDWAPGANCTGVAFRIRAGRADEVWAYLADRELVTRSYFEISAPVTLIDEGSGGNGRSRGGRVDAICYVLDRTHPQYAGSLTLAEQAERIRAARGPAGPNLEYFEETMAHLEALGVADPTLAELARHVRA